MFKFYLLYPIVLLFACSEPKKPPLAPSITTVVTDSIKYVVPSWWDTLQTSPLSKFEFYHGYGFTCLFFVKKFKYKRQVFGVEAEPGTAIKLFKLGDSSHWTKIYEGSLDGGCHFTGRQPDLNFDGENDLLITALDGGIHGNRFSVVFLFDSKQQTFVRDTTLDLLNLTVDQRKKQLRSRYYGSIYGACTKQLYGWENDSLILLGESTFHADTIYFQKLRNGKMQFDTLTGGDKDALWKVFDNQMLWKGDFYLDIDDDPEAPLYYRPDPGEGY